MGLLDIKAVYDYWTNVGNQGAYQAINGGAWDAIAGNSQAVGAAAMSSFIDFFALRTFQENIEKAGYYSAQEGCEGEALKYGGLALGQAGLEVFGGSVFAKFGKWMGRPFWRYVGPHSSKSITWLTRGWGWAAPYGNDFVKAAQKLHLGDYGGIPTDVIEVPYKMLKPIAGPRLIKAYGKLTGAVEYYYGRLFSFR